MADREITEERIREIVQAVLCRLSTPAERASSPPPEPGGKRLITEDDVLRARRQGVLQVSGTYLLTPLAQDALKEYGVRIARTEVNSPSVPPHAVTSVAVGSDHAGFELKEALKAYIGELGFTVQDMGTTSADSVDYPDFALKVAEAVARGACSRGIVVDGAGIGSSMAANKVPGIRAALCHDLYTARNSREHNDANVLTIGSMVIGVGLAKEMVRVWLETGFGEGRHARRVGKIEEIERKYLRSRMEK